MSEGSSNRPVISLVLGILGILCCALCGPVAWFVAKQELNAIAAGHAPAAGEGMAKAGLILGIIGTVLLVFSLLWIFLFGGMAVFQGLAQR
ncbi:MAG: DUF4190 domain-containing protein [Acidobacteriota bacterium]|nr:DUF4190 domain-containing protein [Acidobacteriota bacterium]